MRRLILIDVDGTLVDAGKRVPDSARVALSDAARAGHTLMLCTGRSELDIFPRLWDLGFSGIIGGAGAYVRIGEEVIADQRVTAEQIARVNEIFDRSAIAWIWQGPEAFYASESFVEVFLGEPEAPGESPWAEYAHQVGPFLREGPAPSASKCTFIIPEGSAATLDELAGAVGPGLRIAPGTAAGRSGVVGEVLLRGVTKATGMRAAARHLGFNVGQTIAIGDSINDIEILEAAGVGVAMADAPAAVKAVADMVTASVDSGGLAAALERLGVAGPAPARPSGQPGSIRQAGRAVPAEGSSAPVEGCTVPKERYAALTEGYTAPVDSHTAPTEGTS